MTNRTGSDKEDSAARRDAGRSPVAGGRQPSGARLWARIMLVALAYLVAAVVGLSLVLPAGYTSPLWPAAGLALAVILLCGNRCWPGIWIGAFLVDLWQDLSMTGALVAALLATGITLQALLGAWLTRRFITIPQPLTREGDVWRFLLLGGPVACLVAATVATLVLSGFDRMTAPDILSQWLLWWTGDSLGVLLFTPLVLLAWPGTRSLWPREGERVALPLLVTIALMAAGHQGLARWEQSQAQAEGNDLMDIVYENGIQPLNRATEPLRSLERFFASSEEVTHEEYATFTARLDEHVGIHSVDWALRVPAAERAAFELTQQEQGLADYRTFELDRDGRPRGVTDRPEYYPVLHTAPLPDYQAVLGLDHGFETVRRQAMARAAANAQIVTVPGVKLLRTRRDTLLSFQPIYEDGFEAKNASLEARRDHLEGFIVGVFDVQALFAPLARRAENHRIEFRVTDVTGDDTPYRLAGTLAADTAADWFRIIDFTDRVLRVDMHPAGGYWQPGPSTKTQFVYLLSVLAACLITFSVVSSAGRQVAAEAIVTERTAELKNELRARSAAEEALRESEGNLEITLQSIGDAVLATDAGGRITRMNPVAEELTGWSLREAVGRPVEEVFRIVNEETRRPAPVPVANVLETGRIHGLANHTILIARDGREHHIADSAAPIRDGQGVVRGVVLVFRDVGKEREAERALQDSEARYREFIESSPLGVFVQCGGEFVYMNPKAARLLGADSSDQLLGRKVLDFIHPDSRDAVSERIRRLNEECVAVPALEEKWLRNDGTMFHGEATAVPYLHEGKPAALVLIQDISQRKEAEERLARAMMDAEQANRAKSAFLATMSHEIRTPMNGVIGMVEILAQSRLSDHQVEIVRTIRESATTLLGIIDDILDFSKIEAGRLEIEAAPVSVPDIVEGLCNSLVPVAAAKGVDLSLFISPDIPERVLSDDVRLRQLLYNLVGNAIKFTGGKIGGDGLVSVRVEKASDDPLRLSFRIEDNGIGMKPETLDGLFTPFTQADIATTRRFGGTGLGLTICKRLVEMLQGEIAAESTFGEGSVFTVVLPFKLADEQPRPTLPCLSGLDCILVRDARLHADDMRLYLEHAGARVTVTDDWKSAVGMVDRSDEPIVVIRYIGTKQAGKEPVSGMMANVRHLLITKGRRRRARVDRDNVVTLDGAALRRHALLRAVAVAGGRASPEIFHDHNEQDLAREEATPPPTIAEARAQGRLILVAEDDALNQRVIRQQLALLGYACEVSENGVEALRLWREGSYGLLLTDLHMPEMDGYTLARTIRQEERGNRRLPIVALTANALRGEAGRAREAGIDAYLTKPVPLRNLRDTLEQWLPRAAGDEASPVEAAAAVAEGPAALDVAVLKGLVGDDEEVVRDFLSDYLKLAEELAAGLHAAAGGKDVRQVASIAHRLKSSSRSVGALPLGDLCAALESAGKAEDMDIVSKSVEEFDAAFEMVKIEIQRYLPRSR